MDWLPTPNRLPVDNLDLRGVSHLGGILGWPRRPTPVRPGSATPMNLR